MGQHSVEFFFCDRQPLTINAVHYKDYKLWKEEKLKKELKKYVVKQAVSQKMKFFMYVQLHKSVAQTRAP